MDWLVQAEVLSHLVYLSLGTALANRYLSDIAGPQAEEPEDPDRDEYEGESAEEETTGDVGSHRDSPLIRTEPPTGGAPASRPPPQPGIAAR